MHRHTFEEYVGIKVGWGATAWVPARHVSGAEGLPTMQRCECGEQGYAIPVEAEVSLSTGQYL